MGWRGAYEHATRTVTMVRGMSHREARSTLAHEVQHALAGDVPSPFGLIRQRQELLARRRTAQVLIDPDEYAQAELLRGPYSAAIAHELDVTMRVVDDWQQMLRAMSLAGPR